MRETKEKAKGITLVALVITIILLLILAGITIAQLTQSKLFEKVKLAKEETENKQQLENVTLLEYESELNKYSNNSKENFLDVLEKLGLKDYTEEDLKENKDGILKNFLQSEQGTKYIFENSDRYLEDIINNQEKMEILAESEYSLDKIKNSIEYSELISNSEYWQKIYTKYIPTMTSNTEPSGVATASDNNSGTEPFYSFDEVMNVNCAGSSEDFWVQYEFPTISESDIGGIVPKKMWFYTDNDSGYGLNSTGFISASNDNENFDVIWNFSNLPAETYNYFNVQTTKRYKYFRCTLTEPNNTYPNGNYYRICFNVYGL